ncbi:MAG: radical SAM/SPASM domain-containing protein [Caldisericum sp.]
MKHARILRGPYQMSFDITNKCNFRFLHCYNRSGENPVIERELTDEEVLEFANDLARLKLFNFCFCGGEPFLRFELMCEVGKILSSSGSIVSFVTNGSLVTEEKAKKLLASGVTRGQVSLDGDNPVSHERLRRVKGSFEKAVNAIKILKEVGFKEVDVAFCPTAWNIDEVESTFLHCKELGVTGFRVQPLMLLGRSKEHAKEILPTPLQYRELVKTINFMKEKYLFDESSTTCAACSLTPGVAHNMNIEWGDPVDHLIRFPTIVEHCTTFAGVKADGSLQVSPYLPITVGNIRRHKFSEYWENGLARMWEIPKIKELARRIVSVEDMGRNDE